GVRLAGSRYGRVSLALGVPTRPSEVEWLAGARRAHSTIGGDWLAGGRRAHSTIGGDWLAGARRAHSIGKCHRWSTVLGDAWEQW
ncbi:hypothetical protein GOEFS_029_00010, partial [Gordonia effusa NBRC 100432]